MSQPLRVSEILLRELDDNGILHLSLNDAMRRNWLFADTPRGRGRAGSGALGRAGSDHGNPLKQIEECKAGSDHGNPLKFEECRAGSDHGNPLKVGQSEGPDHGNPLKVGQSGVGPRQSESWAERGRTTAIH